MQNYKLSIEIPNKIQFTRSPYKSPLFMIYLTISIIPLFLICPVIAFPKTYNHLSTRKLLSTEDWINPIIIVTLILIVIGALIVIYLIIILIFTVCLNHQITYNDENRNSLILMEV